MVAFIVKALEYDFSSVMAMICSVTTVVIGVMAYNKNRKKKEFEVAFRYGHRVLIDILGELKLSFVVILAGVEAVLFIDYITRLFLRVSFSGWLIPCTAAVLGLVDIFYSIISPRHDKKYFGKFYYKVNTPSILIIKDICVVIYSLLVVKAYKGIPEYAYDNIVNWEGNNKAPDFYLCVICFIFCFLVFAMRWIVLQSNDYAYKVDKEQYEKFRVVLKSRNDYRFSIKISENDSMIVTRHKGLVILNDVRKKSVIEVEKGDGHKIEREFLEYPIHINNGWVDYIQDPYGEKVHL